MQQLITLTVSQLNEYVKSVLDSAPYISNIYIKGEISNFTNHYRSGHLYFTLKDEGSLLKAVMFSSYSSRLKFMPENGMKVIVRGRVSVFVRDGIYQMYVEELQPDGIGSVYIAFEQLKKKLSAEGLFDEEYKKALPRYPGKIGIITSPDGAAIADMINILSRRFPLSQLFLYPSLVQGEKAPKQLMAGVDYFDRDKNCDLIIIGRGGGSLEDLWAFNDEALARTIFAAKTPVISAVGHETDFTICDFVADLRAPTPSAAAELAVPEKSELKRNLAGLESSIMRSASSMLTIERKKISEISNSDIFINPQNLFFDRRASLASIEKSLYSSLEKSLKDNKNRLGIIAGKLTALNPIAVIARGYAIASDSNEKIITSVKSVNKGDNIHLMISDGKICAKVENVSKKPSTTKKL